MSSHA
jgi:hypothetical protein